jgi:hypothetical protein
VTPVARFARAPGPTLLARRGGEEPDLIDVPAGRLNAPGHRHRRRAVGIRRQRGPRDRRLRGMPRRASPATSSANPPRAAPPVLHPPVATVVVSGHRPQSSCPPQPSLACPHVRPSARQLLGAQLQTFGFPPPQTAGAVHVPHSSTRPHPSEIDPHWAACAWHVVGAHVPAPHTFARPPPPHVWPCSAPLPTTMIDRSARGRNGIPLRTTAGRHKVPQGHPK